MIYPDVRRLGDLFVLDAQHVSNGTLATITLPHRIPNGSHGNGIESGEVGAIT